MAVYQDDSDDYPTTPRMGGAYSPPPDEDESEEGWSDDSGRDSDRFENEHRGKGRAPASSFTTKLPPAPEHPARASASKLSNLFGADRDDGFDDEDEDSEEESYSRSALGGVSPYLTGTSSPKRSSESKVRSAPTPPGRTPSPPPTYGGVEPPGERTSPKKVSSDPKEYIGYRSLDSQRPAVPRHVPPSSGPDPNTEPEAYYAQRNGPPPPPLAVPPQNYEPQPPNAYEDYNGRPDYNAPEYDHNGDPRSEGQEMGNDAGYDANTPYSTEYDDYQEHPDPQGETAYNGGTTDSAYKATYAEDLEAPMEARSQPTRAEGSLAFSEANPRERRTLWCLLIWLVVAMIILAGLVGGLLGSKIFQPAPSLVVVATPAPGSTPAPAPSPPTGPSNPVPAPTPALPVTGRPTEGGSTTAPPTPCIPNPFIGITCQDSGPGPAPVGVPATDAPGPSPTAGSGGPVTNQALYDAIAAASPDGGAAIMVDGTPQNRAFLSVQSENLDLPEDRQIQRYAMRTFYFSTGGDTTWKDASGWDANIDECLWFQSTQDSRCDGNVLQTLEFTDNGITGELPDELAMLTALTRLYIKGAPGGEGLSAGIPESLTGLTAMNVVVLNDHAFTEPLPSGLFSAWSTASLINMVDSGIPGELPDPGAMTAVTNFNMAGNQLSGSVPAGVASLTSLNLFDLSRNSFNGPMPSGLGALSLMRTFSVAQNSITGTISTEFGSMTDLKGGLDLSFNQFEGEIPGTLNNLSQLQSLYLNNNLLIGTVPDLPALSSLKDFKINGNTLTGEVSAATCGALSAVPANSYADCADGGEIVCSCCTVCCAEGTEICA